MDTQKRPPKPSRAKRDDTWKRPTRKQAGGESGLRAKPLSLYPLTPDQVLKKMLDTPPHPKE